MLLSMSGRTAISALIFTTLPKRAALHIKALYGGEAALIFIRQKGRR